jgi:hypothetical protein
MMAVGVSSGEGGGVDSGSTAVGSGVLTGETNSVGLHAAARRSKRAMRMRRESI